MKRSVLLVAVLAAALIMAGCAPGPNSAEKTADAEGHTSGFLLGLWHGFITPVTFVVSLFSDSVGIYEVDNDGAWYDFGYVLGLSVIFSGGGVASRR